jgi:isopenicillin N synthase-like dioxygenase
MNMYVEDLEEIQKERAMGALGRLVDRQIPTIDVSRCHLDTALIAEEVWRAGTSLGFFRIVNHGIPQDLIDRMFEAADCFFSMGREQKEKYPMTDNMGWQFLSQVPPSTRTPDQSESLQMRRVNNVLSPMIKELANYSKTIDWFESECLELGVRLLSAISNKVGVSTTFFREAFRRQSKHYNATLRMLNYFPAKPYMVGPNYWRAGAHTDFGFITLLFQRAGQAGLQVCSGSDQLTDEWIPVEADDQSIVCNIGDMLRRLSGDRLVSNFHRVVIPSGEDAMMSRKSIAFFCQPNTDVLISSPLKKYRALTAGEFFKRRMAANYSNPAAYTGLQRAEPNDNAGENHGD